MNGSTAWLVVIALGAVLVAVGNIQYTRVREIETKLDLAKQALNILNPEVGRNQGILEEFRRTIPKGLIPLHPFDTTAWRTVSGSSLLLGLVDDRLPEWLRAYHLMNRVNELHAQLLELSIGVGSVIHGNSNDKAALKSAIVDQVNELEPLLVGLGVSNTRPNVGTKPSREESK